MNDVKRRLEIKAMDNNDEHKKYVKKVKRRINKAVEEKGYATMRECFYEYLPPKDPGKFDFWETIGFVRGEDSLIDLNPEFSRHGKYLN